MTFAHSPAMAVPCGLSDGLPVSPWWGEEHGLGALRVVTNRLECRAWSRKSHTWADEGIKLAECYDSDGCIFHSARAGIQVRASGTHKRRCGGIFPIWASSARR